MSQPEIGFWIEVNGEEIEINIEDTSRSWNYSLTTGEHNSEQCEGCGADMGEHGVLHQESDLNFMRATRLSIPATLLASHVQCDNCGTRYRIKCEVK